MKSIHTGMVPPRAVRRPAHPRTASAKPLTLGTAVYEKFITRGFLPPNVIAITGRQQAEKLKSAVCQRLSPEKATLFSVLQDGAHYL
jgi:hypothetical protein